MRPLIAVTCSTEEGATNYPRGRDFANRAYSEAVRRAGGAPVLLPLGGTAEDVRAGLAAAHGLLLTGG
ncbi:MAG: gamma-glutamyl-gamma-aminobutyrate hydrolase family protein, partial [Armatimonadetes bacterium]|nr:gamma-glutamyl-gamma-aminobutyrate hydrolase family protein [Armatimonadota bacterium]